ncbi:MAG: Si-specific NAD(P)(+) transhydrogenase [Rhodospirillaceae bacterium]|nr:Si-specific NAD(P)(+) transhydrogenase [Rhodospirillaceae bacterium]
MSTQHYDLIVIGSGPSGRRGAIQAAKLGKTVLVIENKKLGGVSVHTGTIPSKTIRETILQLSGYREKSFYDRTQNSVDEAQLFQRLTTTRNREAELLEKQFTRNTVEPVIGTASFLNENSIQIIDHEKKPRTVTGEKIIIAVGTRCYRPENIEFDGKLVCDSDQLLCVKKLPNSLVVVGAGVIGMEYASILNILGKNVTVIDPRDNYLEFIDRGIINEFTSILKNRGVKFLLGRKLDNIIDRSESSLSFQLDNGDKLKTDMIVYAAGRVGSTEMLQLENCNINTDKRGRIAVNPDTFQTSTKHIYAVGDVIGFPALASASMAQGRIASNHAFNEPTFKVPESFPYGIYSVPEISTCGPSEEDLDKVNVPYIIGMAKFEETSRGQIMGVEDGFLKMLFCANTKKLLSVHIIGEGAAELVHIGQTVMSFNGGIDYFIENIFNFPTLAEAYKTAALNAFNKIQSNNK